MLQFVYCKFVLESVIMYWYPFWTALYQPGFKTLSSTGGVFDVLGFHDTLLCLELRSLNSFITASAHPASRNQNLKYRKWHRIYEKAYINHAYIIIKTKQLFRLHDFFFVRHDEVKWLNWQYNTYQTLDIHFILCDSFFETRFWNKWYNNRLYVVFIKLLPWLTTIVWELKA